MECQYLLKKVEQSDIQILKNIRNECKEYMTNYTYEISEQQQINWYNSLDINTIPYLFYESFDGICITAIGYGLTNVKNDVVWITGGLITQCRGLGLGFTLFKLLLHKAKTYNKEIKLEVLNTNLKAYNLYCRLGFEVVSKNEKITEMKYHDSII